MIAKHDLIKKAYYIGTCRNTNIAEWDGDKFVFINYYFEEPYIETVHFYGDVLNKNIDGFIPIRKIDVEYFEIKEARISQDYKNSCRNIYKNIDIKDIKNEIWKEIVGYEGLYMVSDMGRVKAIKSKKILKQNFSRGYLILGLTNINGIRRTERVHRLVLFTFKSSEYFKKSESNHINSIRTDNRSSNLEWVSHQDNSRKMYLTNHYNKKLKYTDVVKIKQMLADGVKGIDIAKLFNIRTSAISEIKTGKKWTDV